MDGGDSGYDGEAWKKEEVEVEEEGEVEVEDGLQEDEEGRDVDVDTKRKGEEEEEKGEDDLEDKIETRRSKPGVGYSFNGERDNRD